MNDYIWRITTDDVRRFIEENNLNVTDEEFDEICYELEDGIPEWGEHLMNVIDAVKAKLEGCDPPPWWQK